jgi:hypothetical protein
MSIAKRIHDLFLSLFYFERRIDPYYRDTFDKIFNITRIASLCVSGIRKRMA